MSLAVRGKPHTGVSLWANDRYRAVLGDQIYGVGLRWCCAAGHDEPGAAARCGLKMARLILLADVDLWAEESA